MERIDAVLRPLDLTFARYEILRLLSFSQAGAMPMTRLGSLLQVHPTSVTSAVDRLERQGFVERMRREDDGGSGARLDHRRRARDRRAATAGLNAAGLRAPRHRRAARSPS